VRPKRVYIAGPYTLGDTAENVGNAILAANELAEYGFIPFVPHLTHLWHFLCPHPVEFWYAYDNTWLKLCDCLLRLPGESSGSDAEVALAEELGIPVYYSIEEVLTEGYEHAN